MIEVPPVIFVLAIITGLVIAFALVAWLAVMLTFLDPSVHDDLLLDGENFERKNDRNLGRRA